MKTNANRQTVIVTGGASGIGYAIAQQFVSRGANVLLASRSHRKLAGAVEALAQPDHVAFVEGDITQPQIADRIVNAAIDRFGRLDVLVNNAGIFYTKPFTDYTVEDLDGFLGYLRGTYVLTQSAVRAMRQQGRGGAIVNISTILAFNGIADLPSSAPMAAKGGITALTRNLAIELAADNIRINAVAPGVVPTPLYGELDETQLNSLHHMQPLGRYGTPKDIADAVLYLASATWVTGVILPVDGGVDAGGDGTNRRREATAEVSIGHCACETDRGSRTGF
ncbi:MAG TPA: SDR family oxidoreductase [Candidatus Binatia bacterium]|nr:SDR family oxidoreductase [Candidatus Binatia bacterium]